MRYQKMGYQNFEWRQAKFSCEDPNCDDPCYASCRECLEIKVLKHLIELPPIRQASKCPSDVHQNFVKEVEI